MPNPKDLNSYNFNSNPYMDMIGSAPQAQAAPAQQAPVGQPMAQGGNMEEEESQFNRGQNPDRARPLMSAIQQLENYVRESTDRDEIRTARGIIAVISQLIGRGQQAMMQE